MAKSYIDAYNAAVKVYPDVMATNPPISKDKRTTIQQELDAWLTVAYSTRNAYDCEYAIDKVLALVEEMTPKQLYTVIVKTYYGNDSGSAIHAVYVSARSVKEAKEVAVQVRLEQVSNPPTVTVVSSNIVFYGELPLAVD